MTDSRGRLTSWFPGTKTKERTPSFSGQNLPDLFELAVEVFEFSRIPLLSEVARKKDKVPAVDFLTQTFNIAQEVMLNPRPKQRLRIDS
jgi:hypothetical protein